MPALPSTAVLGTLVICVFPLSGQYGLGSRLLYYIFITICVVWRKSELLKKASLAAALLFPAVAAIHGVVLAALHTDGVVDMDVFGAFQLCAIGILAAPVTVKLSSTYFHDPGRNFIFVWTILILTGLLSLTVEFFRTTTSPCPYDDSGQPLSPDPGLFNYTYPPTCQLTCSINSGPFSPIRKGSANNIYVVPAPERISFGTGTLLAGACCIPAVLHLISMWNKILKINWNWHYGNQDVNRQAPIEGTNGATIESMTKVNAEIRKYLIIPEALVFGAAVLSILVLGEMNFFSAQVIWQSEPMSAIGQWAPIVGTILAILGSLYHIRHKRLDSKEETSPTASKDPLNTTTDRIHRDESPASPKNVATRGTIDGRYSPSNGGGSTSTETVIRPLPRAVTSTGGTTPPECVPMTNPPRAVTWRDDGKRRVNRTLAALDSLATPAPNHFDDSEFRSGPAQSYPRIPAEESRNKYLNNIENRYPGNATQLLKQHSRAGSVSSARGINIEGSTTPRAQSPGRSRSDTFPAEQALGELQNATSDMSATSTERMSRRRSTLTVSSPDHQGRRLTISASTTTVDDSINQGPSSPVIVVSHDSQWPDQEDVS